MTETINKEPVEGEAGATEPPAQPPSEPQAEPSAVDEASLKAIIEPLVQDAFDRGAQSTKDKRIAKQESRISGLEDTLAQLKELKDDGLSEKVAIEFLEMREQLGSQRKEVPAETPPAQEAAPQTQVAVEDYLSPILQATGLADTDADVIEITRKESDPAKRMIAIAQLAETRKQAQETKPNTAAVIASGGGQTVESGTLESITKELNEVIAMPATPATRIKIQELRKQQSELIPRQ
jgi:hypothetical protein